PTLCVTVSDDGKHARGSCRSSGDFNILQALTSPGCKELFTKVGGHAFAAGFDLPAENLPLLEKRLNDYAADYKPARVINIDA
ncbi:DHHA1 domain-containing protein, partial [Streptomyces scabiei]|uniref:DHHA1 domain-containing protein n=1 Tax=Streptomyces scabiei TaxID=1930 RepID=UPI0038F628B9